MPRDNGSGGGPAPAPGETEAADRLDRDWDALMAGVSPPTDGSGEDGRERAAALLRLRELARAPVDPAERARVRRRVAEVTDGAREGATMRTLVPGAKRGNMPTGARVQAAARPARRARRWWPALETAAAVLVVLGVAAVTAMAGGWRPGGEAPAGPTPAGPPVVGAVGTPAELALAASPSPVVAQEGTVFVELRPDVREGQPVDFAMLEELALALLRRVNLFPVGGFTGVGSGVVEVAMEDPPRTEDGALDPAFLAYLTAQGRFEIIDPLGQILPTGTIVRTAGDSAGVASPAAEPVYPVVVGGERVVDAYLTADQNDQAAVGFELDEEGADALYDFTSNNIGQPMVVVLDGVVLSAPTVNGAVSNEGIVPGLPLDEAGYLVALLQAGALPVPVTVAGVASVSDATGSLAPGPTATPGVAEEVPRPTPAPGTLDRRSAAEADAVSPEPIVLSVLGDPTDPLPGEPSAAAAIEAGIRVQLRGLSEGCRVGFVLVKGRGADADQGRFYAAAVRAVLLDRFFPLLDGAEIETVGLPGVPPRGRVDVELYVRSGCIHVPTDAEARAPDERAGEVTLTFSATADIAHVEIVADGSTVHAGPLGRGQTVGPVRATDFTVFTLEGDDLWVTNEERRGEPFVMCGDVECRFTLP